MVKKPGADFAFQPKDSLASIDAPEFSKSPKKPRRSRAELEQSFRELVESTTYGPRPVPLPQGNTMSQSRTPSFGDEDLLRIGSQAGMTNGLSSKTPLQPIDPNVETIDLSQSPAMDTKPAASTSTPVFGKTTKIMSSLKQKASNMFIQPTNRPEHHRDQHKINPPSAPKYSSTKPQPLMFSSAGPDAQPAQPTQYTQSSYYSQTAATSSYADQTFYTDPTKASADLKALLEGGMDEDEDQEEKGTVDDGTLEGIKVKLLPHQVEGVEWMKGRELGPVKRGKVPKGGILADDMGLGKTLQSISLIIRNPKPSRDEKGWKKALEGVQKSTLVVAPLALIRQWESEIRDKVTDSHRLSVCVHHGPNRTKRFQDLAKYDVVITTYQVVASEHGHSSDESDGLKAGCFGLHWYRVILDEAHTIKNRNTKSSKACCALRSEYRWCLTGTPMQNNLDELQSLIAFLRITPYNDLKEWKEWIDKPMKNGKGHVAIRRLHSILRCFMKRRTKEILKEEGALLPGGKKALDAAAKSGATAAPTPSFKITERKVVTVAATFSPAERVFYDRLQERADKSLEVMMKGKVNYANALVLLLRLRQACNHPKLVESRIEKDKDALSTDTAAQPKNADADIDALADALGGMGIEVKKCDLCLSELPRDQIVKDEIYCVDCSEEIDRLYNEQPARKKPKSKKKKVKKVVKEEVKVEVVKKRKPKSRRIIESDDEEEEGSWLVGEDQQGPLRLGKAGGDEDENAEGEGESLGTEDSIHHSEDDDGSRLDSFIVNDDDVKQYAKAEDSDSDDDTFLSISKIGSQVVKEEKHHGPAALVPASASDSEEEENGSEDDSGVSESEVESEGDSWLYKRRKPQSGHLMTSAKIRQVIKILHKEAQEHKFIVFSQFTSMLDLIEPFFKKEGFKFTRYDGGMKNDAREESLNRLRNDKNTRILLCSLKCGSLGLNLTAATRVIILEPFWNPFVEEQAIDRVHRLTQTVDVVVYKLTVENTVEERILELQDKKRLLAEQAIEGGMKKGALKLGLQEMLGLFKHDGGAGAVGNGDPRFDDASVVKQDVGAMLGGFAKNREPKKKHGDSAFDRRW